MVPISLQYWSLHKEFAEDYAATAKQLAEAGYKFLEVGFGSGDHLSAKERQKILADAGVAASSLHISWSGLADHFNKIIDDAGTFQTRELVIPWMPSETFASVKSCAEFGEQYGAMGARLRELGFRLSYHHHDYEYALLEGRPALEWMLEASAPRDVSAEIDVCWAHIAGHDPVWALSRMGSRARMVHLKDCDKNKRTTALGCGVIDFPAIFELLDKSGTVEWYAVEQEHYDGSPFESLRRSMDYLKSLGKA